MKFPFLNLAFAAILASGVALSGRAVSESAPSYFDGPNCTTHVEHTPGNSGIKLKCFDPCGEPCGHVRGDVLEGPTNRHFSCACESTEAGYTESYECCDLWTLSAGGATVISPWGSCDGNCGPGGTCTKYIVSTTPIADVYGAQCN